MENKERNAICDTWTTCHDFQRFYCGKFNGKSPERTNVYFQFIFDSSKQNSQFSPSSININFIYGEST